MAGITRFAIISLLASTVFAGPVLAQSEIYPTRPIRLIVPFTPGSGTDIVSRILAPKVTENLGQQVVVDNRPGAGGIVGTEIVARATPDGYTIGLALTSHAINASLYRKLPYDSEKDFAAVTQLISTALVLVVSPSSPVNTVNELVAYVKSKPGQLSFASGGIGSPPHLAGELLKTMTGIQDIVHVPFGGGQPAINSTMSGQTVLYFAGTAAALPFVNAGRLKALAVTGKGRSPAYPSMPTMIEAGVPGYVVEQWYGILAPARTPRGIIAKINAGYRKALQEPEIKDRLKGLGVEPVGSTPEQFSAFLKSEIIKYEKIVKASGARVD